MFKTNAIGSDIDGTMVENNGNLDFLRWLEKHGHANACAIFQQTHSWEKAAGLNREQLGHVYTKFLHSASYIPPRPLPGAPEAFTKLAERCNIHLITSRSSQTKKPTLQHLRQHFTCSFTTATFSALGKKSAYVQQRRPIAYFEDNPEHALEVAQVATVILIPSNTAMRVKHRNIIRPAAHKLVEDGLSLDDWRCIWQHTWTEIPHLVADLIHTCRRTLLPARSNAGRRQKLRTA